MSRTRLFEAEADFWSNCVLENNPGLMSMCMYLCGETHTGSRRVCPMLDEKPLLFLWAAAHHWLGDSSPMASGSGVLLRSSYTGLMLMLYVYILKFAVRFGSARSWAVPVPWYRFWRNGSASSSSTVSMVLVGSMVPMVPNG